MAGSNGTLPPLAFLKEETLQALLKVLNTDEDRALVVGGAVRNALMGEAVEDIDIATQSLPDKVTELCEAAGFRVAPTGIEHGTLTVVVDHVPYEVTTLREDVETDGRRAVIRYTRDFAHDAERRDFTFNALYAEANGTLVDPVGGLEDLKERRLRFVGDPDIRIREDYLRILRFFRFFARYGHGAPDRAAISAIVRLRDGLEGLSAERVWAELKKTLTARNAERALLWMRQTGVYQRVLPESGDMDLFPRLRAVEEAGGFPPDPLTRLMALLPAHEDRSDKLAIRLKLSNAERERLKAAWEAQLPSDLFTAESEPKWRTFFYRHGARGVTDRAMVDAARGLASDPPVTVPYRMADRLAWLGTAWEAWTKPELPVSGRDLIDLGADPGPTMGKVLKTLEADWVQSDFQLQRDALLERAKALLGSG